MFEFEKKCELMNVETRFKKDGSGSYIMVTVLTDNGKTIDLKYDGQAVDFSKLKARQVYNFKLRFVQGQKFSYLNVIEINQAA